MSLPNPLTPRPGYSVTVSQVVGGRPLIRSTCTRCAAFDLTTCVDVAAAVVDIGATVAQLVDDAIHHVSSHISDGG